MDVVRGEDLGIHHFGLEIHVKDVQIVFQREPLQMRQQVIGNIRPQFLAQEMSRAVGKGAGGPIVKTAVKGVELAVIGPHVDDLTSVFVRRLKRRIADVVINQIIPLVGRTHHGGRGIHDIAQPPDPIRAVDIKGPASIPGLLFSPDIIDELLGIRQCGLPQIGA